MRNGKDKNNLHLIKVFSSCIKKEKRKKKQKKESRSTRFCSWLQHTAKPAQQTQFLTSPVCVFFLRLHALSSQVFVGRVLWTCMVLLFLILDLMTFYGLVGRIQLRLLSWRWRSGRTWMVCSKTCCSSWNKIIDGVIALLEGYITVRSSFSIQARENVLI